MKKKEVIDKQMMITKHRGSRAGGIKNLLLIAVLILGWTYAIIYFADYKQYKANGNVMHQSHKLSLKYMCCSNLYIFGTCVRAIR